MARSALLLLPLILLSGWVVITWRAAARLARRRGLTMLAALLDPRSWTAEPVLGVPARRLLVAWAVGAVAAALLVGQR